MNKTAPNPRTNDVDEARIHLLAGLARSVRHSFETDPHLMAVLNDIAVELASSQLSYEGALRELELTSLRKGTTNASSPDTPSSALHALFRMVGSWRVSFRDWRLPLRRTVLTYEEAMRTLVENRPSRFERAAIARERDPVSLRCLVTLVYLDADNRPVPDKNGRSRPLAFEVERLDAELAETFGTQDVFVVE